MIFLFFATTFPYPLDCRYYAVYRFFLSSYMVKKQLACRLSHQVALVFYGGERGSNIFHIFYIAEPYQCKILRYA